MGTVTGITPDGVQAFVETLTAEDIEAAPIRPSIMVANTSTYMPILTDENSLVAIDSVSEVTVSVPSDTEQSFQIGARVDFVVVGSGAATFTHPVGVTLRTISGSYTISENGVATLIKLAANEWLLIGDEVSNEDDPLPEATTTVKGIVKLAGDLGGTADIPTVFQGTHSRRGIVEFADTDEVFEGLDDYRAATPVGVKAYADTKEPIWSYVIVTLETTNSTLVSTNIAGMSIPTLADGLYEFEALCIGSTTAAATGIQIGINSPESAPVISFGWGIGTSGSVQAFRATASSDRSSVIAGAGVSSSAPSLNVASFTKGVIRATSMVGTIDFTIRSETDGTTVSAKPDSFIRYRRIAN